MIDYVVLKKLPGDFRNNPEIIKGYVGIKIAWAKN